MTDQDYARRQQDRAAEGRADGQCPCGSYRFDGKPPVLHNPGCPHTDDWMADPLAVLDLPSGPTP